MQERRYYKGIGFWLLTMILAVAIGTGVSKTAVYASEPGVPYVDENGKLQEVFHYYWAEGDDELLNGEDNPVWYVVYDNITTGTPDSPKRISVKGAVNLILMDGASWTANGGFNVEEGGTLTVYGQKEGTGKLIAQNVKAGYAGIGGEENATIVINGGDITATGSDGSAGIGSNGRTSNATKNLAVTIHRGKIEAKGGLNYVESYNRCAGIGGSAITITGGTINANGGGRGAGIGSCSDKADVTVQISGGDITATGGHNGAGIGGVEGENQSISVTIAGGTVKATGTSAPGIGGSYTFKQCKIIVTGGDVTAIGLAGIGGGIAGTGSSSETKTGVQTIAISGGIVKATGLDGGAGIGGRDFSSCGDITITGGTVTALTTGTGWGNAPAPAIGDGAWRDNYPYTPGTVSISGMKMVKAGESEDSASDTEYAKRSAWWQETTDEAGTEGLVTGLHYVEMRKCNDALIWQVGADKADTLSSVCEQCGAVDQSRRVITASAEKPQITYRDTTTLKAALKDENGEDVSDDVTYAWYLDADMDNKVGEEAAYVTPENLPAGKHTYTVKATYENATATTMVDVTIGKRVPKSKDFSFSPPDKITYNGETKKASVQIAAGIEGMGTITEVWYQLEGQADHLAEVKDAGRYQVYCKVSGGTNYSASECITDDTWTFVIEKLQLENNEITYRNRITYGQSLSELLFGYYTFVGSETEQTFTGTLEWKDPSVKPEAGDDVKAEWVFTPVDPSCEVVTGVATITVNPAVPEVKEPTIASRIYRPAVSLKDTDLQGGAATGVGNEKVEGTWHLIRSDLIPGVETKTVSVVFRPESTNYREVEKQIPITVTKATPAIRKAPQADAITYGDTLEKASLRDGVVVYDSTSVEGSFHWKETSVKPTVADSNTTVYAVVFTPADTANYEEVETNVTVEVHKAATAPYMPEAEMQAANTCRQIGDVSLPKNWNWSEKDQSKPLAVGKAVTATAEYTGEDKENYETLTAEVSVTRAACEEDPSVYYTGEGEKAPTCTEPGTGHTICKLCGDLLREKVVAAAAGHKWNDGIVTTQPTAKAEGVKTYTCTVCGATRTETVPKKEETKVTITTKKPVKKGDVVKSDTANAVFTVTNTKKAEVTYKKPFTADGTIKTITIPDTVTINGKKYKVTAISKNAFKNNKKVTEVSVGKNVTSIGESAFSGCTALRKVTLDEKVTTIGKNAFKGCKNLKRIVIRSTKLNKKNVKKGAFKGISSKAVIEVPKKKRSAYKKLFRQKGLSKKVKFK